MTITVKITELSDIGANLASSTVVPVVNMAGIPITQKTNIGNIANIILEGAGVDYPEATVALLAQTVSNAAQPNITSVGTLTSLSVTGNTALGAVGNVKITGGSSGQILSTDGAGNLSWTNDTTTYGNSNVATLLSAFGSNIISTTGNITGGNLVTGGQVVASGNVSSGTGLSTGGFLSVDGTADLHDTSVTGNLSATGNVTANAFIGDGSQLTNIPSAGTSGEVQVNWLGSFSNQGGTPGDTYSTLQFDSNGMPTLNGTNAYQQRVDYSPYLQVLAPRVESTDFGIVAGPAIQITGYADNVFYNTPCSAYLSVQDQANATQQWDFGILGNGSNNFSIQDRTGNQVWSFGTDGNINIPGLAFNINYANSESATLSPSVGNSGAVQFNWQGSLSNQGGTPGDTYSTLQFDSNGMPTLDGTTAYQQRIDYSPYLQVLAPRVESTDFGIVAGPGLTVVGYDDNYNIPRSAYLSVQDQANATQQWDFGILGNGNNNFVVSDRTNSNQWTFGTDGNTTFPDGTVIQGDGSGIYYPTNDGWNLHRPDNLVWIGSGTNVAYIDTYSPNVSVRIRTLGDPEEGPGYDWIFDPTGNLTLPTNTFSINYANGQQVQLGGGANLGNFVFPNPTSNTSTITVNDGSDIVINPTYGGTSPAYINVPGNINGPTTEPLQIYNGYFAGNANAAAVSIGADVLKGITIFGDGSVVASNTVTVPASDSGSIIFSSDGTSNNGSLKVDSGYNMTVSANSNFYVKQNGSDRLGITNTNTDLMAASNVVIHANKAGTEKNWIFSSDGNLSTPGELIIYGGTTIDFHQQVGNITWGTNYMAFSQYGRVETNIDFFANANTIGAQYLKGDGSNISNINASNITNAYNDSNVISLLSDLGGNGIGNVGNIDISGNINFTNNSAVQQSSIVVNPFRTIETVTLSANSQNNATLLTLEDTGNANLRAWQDINLNTYTQTTNNNFKFDASGNLTIPGNISGSGANGLMISSNGNVTLNSKGAQFIFDAPAGNFYLPNPGGAIVFADSSVQNTAYTGSIAGANVTGQVGNALVAGTVYTNAQPNITSVGTLSSLSVTGNVSANNFTGNGSQLTGIPTQTTGNWELVPGVNTVNISVPINGTYSIWVKGNIPNGIVTYTATAVVTNTNVPVLGTSYGWYYAAGNALVLTSIPTQFVGTLNNISNAVVATTTANVFTFGITNNSGANAVVNWGYTKL